MITVKGNQKTLYQQLQSIAQTTVGASIHLHTEQTRNRYTTRTVSRFALPDTIKADWAGAQHGVEVTRSGRRGDQLYAESHYYLTSLGADAAWLQDRIRCHWRIENLLHWVKDVVLVEDCTSIAAPSAATLMAFIRNLAITLFRRAGHSSITAAIDRFSNDIDQLLPMLDFSSA